LLMCFNDKLAIVIILLIYNRFISFCYLFRSDKKYIKKVQPG